MEIQILRKKLIPPSSPTPHHRRTLNISPVDVIAPPVYMAVVGYYPAPDNVDLETMGTSLSENLSMFYPFAGRYDQKSQTVDCNDRGVEYVEARVNCELARIMYGKEQGKLLDGLAPAGAESETTPLMLIQVNVFECGGVAVGIRFSHRIADAMTVSMFVNGWATTSRQGIKSVSPPNFEMGYIFPIKDKEEAWVKSHNPWKKEPSNIVTKRFVFTKQAISSLRSLGSHLRISRVMALTALLWNCFMKASGDRSSHGSLLTHIFNMRRRTHASLPDNVCGNFWRCSNTRYRRTAGDVKVEELMELLCASMKRSAGECRKEIGGDELMRESAEGLMELCQESEREDADFRIFTSWCRFPMYEADFGWGRPSWVSSVHLPVRITVLVDAYDGEGIEAWVSLEDNEMANLETDDLFLTFAT